MKVYIAQSPFAAIRIAESDAAEFNAPAQGNRQALMPQRDGHLRFEAEKIEKVSHEEVVLVDGANGSQDRLKRRLSLAENTQIKGHIARGDFAFQRLPDDPCVRAVETQRRDQTQTEPDDGSTERERFVFLKELFEQRHIARQ
jgi:hypothetical protein